MITIDARKDFHNKFRYKTTIGALAHHMCKLKEGDSLTIDVFIDRDGNILENELIKRNIRALRQHLKCKISYITKDGKIKLFLKSKLGKNKELDFVDAVIDARIDSDPDFREGTLSGALAKHLKPLKDNQVLRINSFLDKYGKQIADNSASYQVVWFKKIFGGQYLYDNGMVKVIRAHDKPLCSDSKKPVKKVQVTSINSFLMGRIGHEPRTA